MENAYIKFIPATIPEGKCFNNDQERLNWLASHLVGYLPGNFTTLNTGSSEPTVENRSLPWYSTNDDGSPNGMYSYFNGSWVQKHPIPASSGFRFLWAGTVGDLDTLDGGNAGTISEDTGPFWEVDTAFADKILIGAGTNAAVNVNAAQLATGSSATDEVRGIYIIKRTARKYYKA
jgi:hypothetical protein